MATRLSTGDGKLTADQLLSFFDLSKPLPKREINPGNQKMLASVELRKKKFEKEKELKKETFPTQQDPYYDDPRVDNSIPGEVPFPITESVYEKQSNFTEIFNNYDFTHNTTPELPITEHRNTILKTIDAHPVTIIQGSTGSGKSTQVPQYILDQHARDHIHCNIICTQPRRIAAISVAKFVSECRNWELGKLVGYQIAMDAITSDDTRLTFVTTGVLLMKLINMKSMNEFTHVILDEVHERDKDTDFCLLLVLRLLRTNSKNVKVILMSATLESNKFADYFSDKNNIVSRPPILNIEGHTYPVTEFFAESLREMGRCEFPTVDKPCILEGSMMLACNIIKHFDELERHQNLPFRGTVLVFLPGMPEIKEMEDVLFTECPMLKLQILPLHSTISKDEQYRVFFKPEFGKRKIILATNIAESSITVPDVKYVIDFCLTKQLMCDKQTNYQYLKLCWASKASLTQRKGRAGRVSYGRCYRLITEDFYVSYIDEFNVPEISRSPIETVVLLTKQLDIGEPKMVLRWAITKPKLGDIEKAILTLKEVGGLTLTIDGQIEPHDGHLTFMGHVLASLPTDVRIGKLLILGYIFGCLEECLIIGSGLSIRSVFTQFYNDDSMNSYKSKLSWANCSFSDCIAILNAYKEWFMAKRNKFANNTKAEIQWCKRNLINKLAINELNDLIHELISRLSKFNIKLNKELDRVLCSDMTPNELLLLKLVICGSFYPNYFFWGEIDEVHTRKDMSGHNPTTTVMLSGLPTFSHLYYKEIAALFADCGRGKALHFENTKVFLEFEKWSGKNLQKLSGAGQTGILDSIYIALKKRHRRQPLMLRVPESSHVPPDKSVQRSTSFKLPPAEINNIKGFHPVTITEVVDPGHFWIQYMYPQTQSAIMKLDTIIKGSPHEPLVRSIPCYDDMVGQYCLALYSSDHLYYRGFIESVDHRGARVFFVDYGNVQTVRIEHIMKLPDDVKGIPVQAIECYLAGVRPGYGGERDGFWSKDSVNKFCEIIDSKQLLINVYSEINGILRVDLWDTTNPNQDLHINELLVQMRWAVYAEEPLLSKLSHEQLDKSSTQQLTNLTSVSTLTIPWPLVSTSDWEHYNSAASSARMLSWRLNGPTNPYEVSFYAMTKAGGLKSTRIDGSSVNSMVLNDEPQDKHHRLMVAATVALNATGNTVLARNTTLLPNIHGLGHLLCLLFAPTVELRVDPLKRQYTGAICGLGCDFSTGVSLYPDHDMEIVFDAIISQDDVAHINEIRSQMNLALESSETMINWGGDMIRKMQADIKSSLLKLVLQLREPLEPTISPLSGWNLISPDDLISTPSDQVNPPLYSIHSLVNISGSKITSSEDTERIILLKKVKELQHKASRSKMLQSLTCPMCNVTVPTPYDLMVHINSKLHKTFEQKLEKEIQDACDSNEPIPITTPTMWKQMVNN